MRAQLHKRGMTLREGSRTRHAELSRDQTPSALGNHVAKSCTRAPPHSQNGFRALKLPDTKADTLNLQLQILDPSTTLVLLGGNARSQLPCRSPSTYGGCSESERLAMK